MGRKPASPFLRGKSASRRPEHTKFITFVTNVLTRAEVTTPTLLAALVYIDRAKPHLHIGLEQWALERVFLGSIIVASKVCLCRLSYNSFSHFVPVFERFHSKEHSLGPLHRRLRQTRRRPYRTWILRSAQLRTWHLRSWRAKPPSRPTRCHHVSATYCSTLHTPSFATITFYEAQPSWSTRTWPL